MNVIVAGEESGVVRDAFIDEGHRAWSCDLKPSRSNRGPHYQGSWRDIQWDAFDIGILHPECGDLCSSGARWFPEKRRDGRQQAAIDEFLYLANAPIDASCLENSIGIMSTLFRAPDQILQPWMLGVWETKASCYWLKNLPRLKVLYRTIDECREALRLPPGSKPVARVHKMGPSKVKGQRSQMRAATLPEIARAMATQWGIKKPA
jgi:hypothetical protein